MSFNSLHFFLFFPIVAGVYFTLPHRFRWILLLLASAYFYMSWKAEYVLLIALSIIVNYCLGLWIHASQLEKTRFRLLIAAFIFNLGLLFAFKYFNFFSESIRILLQQFSFSMSPLTLTWLLPVGISFYTFQALSYVIDVYRMRIIPEKHLGIFALYISFFPQLVAGPIERAGHLLPQFREQHFFEYQRATDGLKLMLWGLFKKMAIADPLAGIVDPIYASPTSFPGFYLMAATVFFAVQISCDFSGYSDIARGAAKVMGFSLQENFRRPYFSRSISEFWQRWHISLSSWLKDYVYFPLGGSRVSIHRWCANISLVFLASGLWHGANWTFVIWGALHGFYLIFERLFWPLKEGIFRFISLDRLPRVAQFLDVLYTFSLVNVGWIFFRAQSLGDAYYILTHLFSNFHIDFSFLRPRDWLTTLGLIAVMELVQFLQERGIASRIFAARPLVLRWGLYIAIFYLILLSGGLSNQDFIYFQF